MTNSNLAGRRRRFTEAVVAAYINDISGRSPGGLGFGPTEADRHEPIGRSPDGNRAPERVYPVGVV